MVAISDAASIPSRRGILTSMMTRSGFRLSAEIDRFLAVAGLPDHFIAFLTQHLGQVHSDGRLIFGDEHAAGCGSVGHDGYCRAFCSQGELGVNGACRKG